MEHELQGHFILYYEKNRLKVYLISPLYLGVDFQVNIP